MGHPGWPWWRATRGRPARSRNPAEKPSVSSAPTRETVGSHRASGSPRIRSSRPNGPASASFKGALSARRSMREGRGIVRIMPDGGHVERLMEKVVRAIEVSLRATEASREAIQEILRRGADTAIFFAGDGARTGASALPAEESAGVRAFDLTQQDRDFLRSLSIRPEPR